MGCGSTKSSSKSDESQRPEAVPSVHDATPAPALAPAPEPAPAPILAPVDPYEKPDDHAASQKAVSYTINPIRFKTFVNQQGSSLDGADLEDCNRALECAIEEHGGQSVEVVSQLCRVATAQVMGGKCCEALDTYKRAHGMTQIINGEDTDEVIELLGFMVVVYLLQDRYEEALATNDIMKEIQTRVHGKKSEAVKVILKQMAETLKDKAGAHLQHHEAEDALEGYEKAVDLLVKAHGEHSPEVQAMRNNLMLVYEELSG